MSNGDYKSFTYRSDPDLDVSSVDTIAAEAHSPESPSRSANAAHSFPVCGGFLGKRKSLGPFLLSTSFHHLDVTLPIICIAHSSADLNASRSTRSSKVLQTLGKMAG